MEEKQNQEVPTENARTRFSRRTFLKLAAGAAVSKIGLDFLGRRAEAQTYPYPPSEVLQFNPNKDSGWFYAANTVPDENGIAFWVAPIRSFSKEPIDATAQLLYGITDTKSGKHYSGFIQNGAFSEDPSRVNLSYSQNGQELIAFHQTQDNMSEFELKVNLPWDQGRTYQSSKILPFNRPVIYESGDGVVPMGGGIDSLYASLALEQGVWVDFQKFNLSGTPTLASASQTSFQNTRGFFNPAAETKTQSMIQPSEANHRWNSFMLTESVGILPAGTVGVCWEILDKNNQRPVTPLDLTVMDLLIPGQPQKDSVGPNAFQIVPMETWADDTKTKNYIRKWRLTQPELGVDLVISTIVPNQESIVLGNYFYEGITQIFDPSNPQKQVGTGMLEQTHSEPYKTYFPLANKTP